MCMKVLKYVCPYSVSIACLSNFDHLLFLGQYTLRHRDEQATAFAVTAFKPVGFPPLHAPSVKTESSRLQSKPTSRLLAITPLISF